MSLRRRLQHICRILESGEAGNAKRWAFYRKQDEAEGQLEKEQGGAIEEGHISRYDHHCGHDRYIRGINEACDGECEGVNPAWCACVPGVRDRSDKQVVCRLVGILPDDVGPISAKEDRDPRQA